MVYDVYHDESKEDAYWHVFLFVSRDAREELLCNLSKARGLNSFSGRRLNFKSLRSNTSFSCAKSWVSILVAALQQVKKERMESFFLGRASGGRGSPPFHPEFGQFHAPPKCKLGIFRLENGLSGDAFHLNGLSKIETTFRMGLQGAAHYLFNESEPLEIGNIFLDREEHYRIEYKRDFNKSRILSKLDVNFRGYCAILPECKVMGEGIGYENEVFLDLADIALGTVRFATITPCQLTYADPKQRKRVEICRLFLPLIKRLREGYARMQNSRFANFGTFSSAKIENGSWQFENLSHRYLYNPTPEIPPLFRS